MIYKDDLYTIHSSTAASFQPVRYFVCYEAHGGCHYGCVSCCFEQVCSPTCFLATPQEKDELWKWQQCTSSKYRM